MEKLFDYLNHPYLYLVLAALAATLVYIVLRLAFSIFVKQADKVASRMNNTTYNIVLDAFKRTKLWFFAAFAIFLSAEAFKLAEYYHISRKIFILAAFIQSGIWMSVIFRDSLKSWSQARNQHPSQNAAVTILIGFSKFVVWAVVLLLILDNMGIKVVSLLTGLGIGGIALALAVQKILGDLFASISIMLDKPFEVGDLINTDMVTGFVESIGVKTTRVRSITGEQVIIANSDLLDSRINNFKRMSERRITLSLSVSSQTAKENLHTIVDMVKNIINNQSDARFDRGHLKSFSASSVDYEIVFWITKPEYLAYMDIQEKINLAILDAFAEKKINLAYPAQKILLEKN